MIAETLLAATVACAPPPVQSFPSGHGHLAHGISVLRVSEPAADAATRILAGERCDEFRPIEGTPRFGKTGDTIWLRFRIDIPDAERSLWRLRLDNEAIAKSCVHWPRDDGGHTTQCPSDAAGTGPAFHVPADLDTRRAIYLSTRSSAWLKLPIEVGRVDEFWAADHTRQFSRGLFLGALLLLVAIASVIGLLLRSPLYSLFAAHYGALTLGIGLLAGWLVPFGAPAWSTERIPAVAFGLYLAFGALYFQRLLDTRGQSPRAHKVLHALAAISGLAALVSAFAPALGLSLVAAAGMFWMPGVCLIAALRAVRGSAPAWFTLGAMMPMFLAGFFKSLEPFGIALVPPEFSNELVQIGSLAAASLLVFAMVQHTQQRERLRQRDTEIQLTDQQLSLHRARYDEVTGLPNREKFIDALREALIGIDSSTTSVAMITVGIDNFRTINHSLGLQAGDNVLHEIAQRLRRRLSDGEFCGRVGPDIFGIIVRCAPTADDTIETLVNRCGDLQDAVGQPLRHGDGNQLGASVGLAIYPDHGLSADALIRHSDAALFRAKELGGGALEVFKPHLMKSADRHLRLSRDLRKALENDEFELFYQPIVSLADGSLASVEALLRWTQSDGTVVPPDQFIPVAESSDLIQPVSDWVFNEACRQLAQWRQSGEVGVDRVSVNLSPRQFRLPGLVTGLRGALLKHGIDGSCLDLEITEGIVVDNLAGSRDLLLQIRSLGMGVSVDDFGVGFSSLSYLRNLPITTLKIDRTFLRGTPNDPEANTVITAMVRLGNDLGLNVIAEGIETTPQRDFLIENNCHMGQGYLFCQPLPADRLVEWVRTRDLALSVA